MASWIDPFIPGPGKQWWGTKFLNLCFKKIEEVVDGKAPADHEHVAGGTTIVTRGDDTARAATGTTLHVRTDVDLVERVEDGAVEAVLADTGQTLYAKHPIIEWAQADSDHPYDNFYNSSARGKATVMLPVSDEAWLLGSFAAMVTGADIQVVLRYMMSTSDTDPVNWGLAYAAGNQDLCAVPWQAGMEYGEGDRICPTMPNGCWYYVDTGNSGTSDSSEPTWPTTIGQTVADNGVTLTCGGTDNYNTISLTGEQAPSIAWDETTKQFTLDGNG